MGKQNKRELILKSIIRAYLDNNNPIGSSELGSKMNFYMPASTIRVYFKKLSDEGQITQLHISGGRIPTVAAMKNYWYEIFSNFNEKIEIIDGEMLNFLCKEFEIYCMVFLDSPQFLEEILNLNDRFLILNFTKDELVLKFDNRIFRFLFNLKGVSLDKLETISAQVGLSELKNKIRELKRSKICFQSNEMIAFNMFKDERFKMILEPSFEHLISKPISFNPFFDSGYMGLNLDVDFYGESASLLCAGSVYVDYDEFLNKLMEA